MNRSAAIALMTLGLAGLGCDSSDGEGAVAPARLVLEAMAKDYPVLAE